MSTSWVLHCGSQHKTSGNTNVNFDLNLNQTLEFPDDTKCLIANLCIPNNVPNVSDAFDNRTWKFKFRMYAYQESTAVAADTGRLSPLTTFVSDGVQRTSNAFSVVAATPAPILHSEYEMIVPIPEGSYQQSDAEANFTESTNIPKVAGCIRQPIRINNINASTITDVVGAGPDYTATNTGTAANFTDGRSFHAELYSQLLCPSHRYGSSTSGRNRTYAEALQYAIWHTQSNIRFSMVKGLDNLTPGPTVAATFVDGTTPANLAANEIYKLRILKLLLSEMNITVNTNANHQLNFIFRSNFAQNSDLASNINHYLANPTFMSPTFASMLGLTNPSGGLTTFRQVNPWAADGSGVAPWGVGDATAAGCPTHFIQCQITAPKAVRFNARTVQNCLDFYNVAYKPTIAAQFSPAVNNVQVLGMDSHWKSSIGVPSAAIVENTGQPATSASNPALPVSNTGNFTPYGLTWTGHAVTKDRTDAFRYFTVQDGTDGWFGCAYFGVYQKNAACTYAQQGVFMYAPAQDFAIGATNNTYLQYINDVQCNHVTDSAAIQYPAVTAPSVFPALQVPFHNLVLYPGANVIGVGGPRGEFLSGVFTGFSVFVTSAEIINPSLSSVGLSNLIGNLKELHAMDCESTPTFIVEVELMGVSNHMKFNGQQDVKRVSIVKRVPLNAASYGGFMRSNADSQEAIDYGTCLGLSKVSSIKCRILNENGQVLSLAQPDSFPPWSFSLVFECAS